MRVYSPRDRARLKLILRAKRLGFSLSEARQIIEMYDSPRDTEAQMRAYLEALATHRQRLEMQLAELQANLMEVESHEEQARQAWRQMQAGAQEQE